MALLFFCATNLTAIGAEEAISTAQRGFAAPPRTLRVTAVTDDNSMKLYCKNHCITVLQEEAGMAIDPQNDFESRHFTEFRRKVRSAEVLSAAMEQLLRALQFTGKVSVVVQNGRVLKSGYEEGYFRQREP